MSILWVIGVAAMIEIDRGERIVFGQNVGDAVGLPGLHSGECGCVVASTCWDLRAGMPIRLRRHERRLLPTAVSASASSATPPIAAARSAALARVGSFARSL